MMTRILPIFTKELITSLCLCLLFLTSQAQKVARIEYYIDEDPGFGKGKNVSFVAGDDVSASFPIDIKDMDSGFHHLFVRSFVKPYQVEINDSTTVTRGGWSVTSSRTFYKENFGSGLPALSNIEKGEYFVDTDPGMEQGVNIPVTPGTDLNKVSFVFDITGLDNGFHSLYVRFRDKNKKWSLSPSRIFYKDNLSTNSPSLAKINKGEYFIDNDPGYGKGINIAVSPSTDLNNISFAADMTSIGTGFHHMYIRFRNEKGIWSLSPVRTFYKEDHNINNNTLAKIVKGEYFLDQDPGFDKGVSIPVTAGADLKNVSFAFNIAALKKGFHQLYTRFKDANGNWALTNSRSFYKDSLSNPATLSKIQQIEYFIDKDPGFGKGIPVVVAPATNLDNITFEIEGDTLSMGDHIIFVRARDENGIWSILNHNEFRIEPPSGLFITVGQIDKNICAGSTISVPFTVNGSFSEENIFTAQLSDTDGGFINPRNIGTLASSSSGTIKAEIPYVSPGTSYRIRVIASAPKSTSLSNNAALTINSVPPVFSITGDTVTCLETKTYNLSNSDPNSEKYVWTLSGGGSMNVDKATATIDWTSAGSYQIKVKYTGVCAGGDSVKVLNVSVTDKPLTGSFDGMLPEDGNSDLELPITFSWLPVTNAVTYDLYIWQDINERPATPTVSDLTAINYRVGNAGLIQYDKTYKWQIVAKRACFKLESPIQTFKPRRLPDVVVSDVIPAASGFSGQSFSINWQVKNIGSGGTLQGQWFDDVYLSTDKVFDPGTDTHLGAIANVSELKPDESYAQTGTFVLPQGISNNYYVFVITNVNGMLPETDLTNNTTVSTETASIQLTPPPDLRVTSVVPPNFVFSGQEMTVIWKVTNAGTGSTKAESWNDDIYLSKDSVLNVSNASYLGAFNHSGALDAGKNYTSSQTVKLPESKFGKYYLFVRTDVNNNVYEHASENNNTTRSDSINIILTPPIDLAVTKVTVTPLTLSNRENLKVQWRVENAGGSPTEGRTWIDNIYLSKDSTFADSSAIYLSGVARPAALAAGEGYDKELSVPAPDNLTGKYFLYVVTDAAGEVFEYELENNNKHRTPTSLDILSADLIVTDLVVPAEATSGQQAEVKWKLKNNSLANLLTKGITDRISISPDSVYDKDKNDLLLDVSYNTGNIAAGSTVSKSATVTLPAGISGKYYIYVETDLTNAVYEGGKDSNNITRSTIPLEINMNTWADLQVSKVTIAPDSVFASAPVPLSYTVVNKGAMQLTNVTWIDKVYISAKTEWDSTEATFLREFSQSRTLSTDESYIVNADIIIPSRFGLGNYYIYVVTDSGNQVPEYSDEGNNAKRSKVIHVKQYPPVDIAVTSVTAPAVGGSDTEVTVQWSVKNQGDAATIQTRWNDVLYLSRDEIWNKDDDVLMKEYVHVGALAVNQSYSNQQTALLPNGLSGVFYLLLVTDDSDFNNDVNRSNNARLVTQGDGGDPVKIEIELVPPSDLKVTAFNIAANGQARQPLTAKWTVKNIGTGVTAARSWTDKIYFSTDGTIDYNDLVVATYARQDSLVPRQEYSDTIQVFLPVNALGNYYILFKTDANDNLAEYQGEQNNTASSVISVAKAPISDLIVSEIQTPETAVVGESITIQWKLKNIGAFPASGYLKDAVYLSEDKVRDVNDILLVSQTAGIFIDPDGEVVHQFTGELKGASLKEYYVLVYTDVLNNMYEENDNNNNLASSKKVNVTVNELPVNVATTKTMTNSQQIYYRIEVSGSLTGQTLLVSLKGDSLNGANEMYLRHNQVPGRAVYDYSFNSPFAGNQEVLVPELKAGTYYLMVTGTTITANVNTQQITLLAEQLNFEIRSVNSHIGGNNGPVTILVSGSKLGDVTDISLRKNNQTSQSTWMKISDPTKIYATFNLNGASLGKYDVVVKNSKGDTAVLHNGFEVVSGTAASLVTNVVTPPSTRPSNIISLTVQYTNSGNTDIINPVIKLSSLGGAPIGFNVSELSENIKELTLNLNELNGPDKVLRPGASGTVIVYAKAVTALGFMLQKSNE